MTRAILFDLDGTLAGHSRTTLNGVSPRRHSISACRRDNAHPTP